MRIFGLLPRGLRKIFAEASHHACILPCRARFFRDGKPSKTPSKIQAKLERGCSSNCFGTFAKAYFYSYSYFYNNNYNYI